MDKEKKYHEQLGYDLDHPFYRAEDKPVVTNADRIRDKTEEELAEFESTLGCHPDARRETCLGVNRCADCWLGWLKREAE